MKFAHWFLLLGLIFPAIGLAEEPRQSPWVALEIAGLDADAESNPAIAPDIVLKGADEGVLMFTLDTARTLEVLLPEDGSVDFSTASLRVGYGAKGVAPLDVSYLFEISHNIVKVRPDKVDELMTSLKPGLQRFGFEVSDAKLKTFVFDLIVNY